MLFGNFGITFAKQIVRTPVANSFFAKQIVRTPVANSFFAKQN
jgi:hypothetical protein